MKEGFERGDTISCRSLGDQRDWEELLQQKGYSYTTDPARHIITILEEPKCEDQ